jgi:hypothetical protein
VQLSLNAASKACEALTEMVLAAAPVWLAAQAELKLRAQLQKLANVSDLHARALLTVGQPEPPAPSRPSLGTKPSLAEAAKARVESCCQVKGYTIPYTILYLIYPFT